MGTMKRIRVAAPLFAVAIAVIASASKPVRADAEADEKRERCATRVSIALHGAAAPAALLSAANPQDQVDTMLADPLFVERFARFTNSEFNPQPGVNIPEDASYTLSKYVLTNKKPWSELFVGAYDVTNTVTADPNGLGYFRSDAWMRRYAGNEQDGYRLSAAYRIQQNTTGLKLTAVTNVAGVDITATGRQAAACAGCHYQNWYALDKVAKILSRRKGLGANMTFLDPNEGPQTILGGKTLANDKELVTALVASTNFKVNACRLAFKYLYGRPENTCEAQVFEHCIDAFTKDQTMQSAIAAVAKDPTFCQ
jgi:hypothetical protein